VSVAFSFNHIWPKIQPQKLNPGGKVHPFNH